MKQTKVITGHPERNKNSCTGFHGDPANFFGETSVWTNVVDRLTGRDMLPSVSAAGMSKKSSVNKDRKAKFRLKQSSKPHVKWNVRFRAKPAPSVSLIIWLCEWKQPRYGRLRRHVCQHQAADTHPADSSLLALSVHIIYIGNNLHHRINCIHCHTQIVIWLYLFAAFCNSIFWSWEHVYIIWKPLITDVFFQW